MTSTRISSICLPMKATIALSLLASLMIASTADAARGRPVRSASGATFVADNGQLLRGPFASTEWTPPPTYAQLEALKSMGFNSVHLYAEVFDPNYPNPGSQSPGYALARVDQMVQMTRDLGLYLVMTIGNGANNGTFNGQYINDFWTLYAPRYKDETHVIYEIQNEPHAWSAPYPQAALDMEASAYTLIRSHAPNTPILLFSFAVLGDGPTAVNDIRSVSTAASIDWRNAGVAVHGYAGPEDTRASIQHIVGAGYPVFLTEFYSIPWGSGVHTVHADPEMTADMERLGISWLSFHHTPNQIFDAFRYTDVIERAGLSWTPDFGTWPAQRGVFGNGGEPRATTGLTGTLRIQAEDFDTGGQGVAYSDTDTSNSGGQYRAEGVDIETTPDTGGGYNVGWMNGGEWLEYTIFVTEPGTIDLSLRVASPSGGAVRVHLNGADKTGLVSVPNTGAWQTWTTLTQPVQLEYGRQKIRVEVVTGGWNLNWIELKASSAGAVANGSYKLVNRNSGKAMQGDTTVNKVAQFSYSGSTLQQWTLQHLGASQYSLRSVNNNWSWSMFYGFNGDPLDFVPWFDVNSRYQRYIVTPLGNGYHRIASVKSGLGIETQNAALADGARMQQFAFAGKPHQQWAIQAFTAPAIPTSLTAAQVTSTRVDLSWTGATGATSYNVKRSTTAGGPYTTVATGVASTAHSDLTVAGGTTYYYVVSAVGPNGESLNSAEATPSRLHTHLAFDEGAGTTASDATGNGWNGALVNGPLWTTGRFGGAVDLDGIDDHVTLPAGVVNGLSEVTVAAWVHLDTASTWSRIFDFGSGTGNYMFLTPRNGINGTLRFAITTGSGEQVINGGAQLPTGAWKHVAVTLGNGTGVLYVDGAEVGRNNSMTLTPGAMGNTLQNYIGRSQWSNDPYLNGRLDEFRIYPMALSAVDIAALAAYQPATPPAAPSDLIATAMSTSQINLSWSDNAGNESGFAIDRATNSSFTSGLVTTSVGANATSHQQTGLAAATTYYFRVRATSSAGASANSNTASATTLSVAAATSMHVASITVTTVNAGGGKKRGQATVIVLDNLGNPVPNATVSGTFSGTLTGSQSAVTNSTGVATLTTSGTAKGRVNVTFCVGNITHATLTYDSSANTETCDSGS